MDFSLKKIDGLKSCCFYNSKNRPMNGTAKNKLIFSIIFNNYYF